MKHLCFLALLMALYYCSNGQNYSIIGKVIDSTTGETLTNATIQLVRVKDSVIIRKAINQRNGFVLSRVPVGGYHVLLSFVGYSDTAIRIQVHEKDSLISLGLLRMRKSSGTMLEVVIRAVIPPVIVKNDTIVYNTEAFKTRPNATVAELLKQLPGMEVDKEGNVTFQGERVHKIYVDGKEFFLNDPKLATQNLLADMVQKVEAFIDKSERARLTGIPDNNSGKAINLRLKADKKRGLMGTLEAGYGSLDRFGMKATANYFKGEAFMMASISSSNGGNVQNGSPGLLNNNQNTISLNYRNKLSKDLQIAGEYAFYNSRTRNAMSSKRETFFADSSLLQDISAADSGSSDEHRINTSLNWTIDSFNILNAYASLGTTKTGNSRTENAGTDLKRNSAAHDLNSALTDNQNMSNAINGSISVNYSHIFRKKGRYFGLSVNNGISKNDGRGNLKSLTRFYDGNDLQSDSLERNQRSNSNDNGNILGFGINYTEPVGKNQVLDFGWNFNSSTSTSERRIYNYNPLTGKYDAEDSLASNAFNNINISQQFSLGYNYFNNKWGYQLGVSVSKSRQKNTNEDGKMENINQKAVNLFPRASFIYTFAKQKNLQFNYTGSTRQSTIRELQPLPDYSNPLLIHLGNPVLKQEFSNNISFNYNYFDRSSSHSFMWRGQLGNTANKIVNSTSINAQGIQERRYVNVKGNYNISISIGYGLPLGKNRKFGGVNSSTRISYGQDVNLVNGKENKKRSWILSQSINVNFHKDDRLFAGLQAGINWNRVSYSAQTMNAANFLSQYYSCNVAYEFLAGIVVSNDLGMSFSNRQGSLDGSSTKVWNATAMKRLLKNKVELKFSVFDILNDNNNFNQVTGDNYIETTEQDVMKKAFVISFMYRFTKMRK